MSLLVASVAVPRPVRRLFTYSVPEALAPRCLSGVRVIVPFGRRKLTGYVLDVRVTEGAGDTAFPLKPVEDVLDPEPVLDAQVLELARFAADYYVASLGEMIRAASLWTPHSRGSRPTHWREKYSAWSRSSRRRAAPRSDWRI
ncbi:MAG: hypothetical protein AUG09_03410 [Acidobacteria bacterium 13_1_20CM_2_68_7]|nr:MAG: hypothetical protein AUG09_03410 [Acidobacteria bacterium 13_1_20CM_2_68_7]